MRNLLAILLIVGGALAVRPATHEQYLILDASLHAISAQIDTATIVDLKTITPQIKLHRADTFNVSSASVWEAAPMDTKIDAETAGDIWTWPVGSDSASVIVSQTGLYLFGGCVHFQNNTGSTWDTLTIFSRITVNSTEARCSQRDFRDVDRKSKFEMPLSYVGTIAINAGDTVRLELRCNKTDCDFIDNSAFDDPVAYTMWLIYLGYK